MFLIDLNGEWNVLFCIFETFKFLTIFCFDEKNVRIIRKLF